MIFPTKGGAWTLYQEDVDEWQAQFSAVRVEDECHHAHAWCEANPRRRKTPGGMRRFLVAWLTRAAARAPHRYVPRPSDWTCPHRDADDTPMHGSQFRCQQWDALEEARQERAAELARLPMDI